MLSIADKIDIARRHLEANRHQAALAVYQAILEQDPDQAQARMGAARALLVVGQAADALGLLDGGGDSIANSAEAAYLRGQVHRLQGHPNLAIESLREAVRLDPDHLAARADCAVLLSASRRPAEEVLDFLGRRWPTDAAPAELLFAYGLVYEQAEDIEPALKLYQRAVQRQPELAPAWLRMGNLLLAIGETESGIESLETALLLQPGDSESVAAFARALAVAGQADAAREMVANALRFQADDVTLLFARGQVELLDSRGAEAVAHLAAALRAAPSDPSILGALAHAFRLRGDPDQASAALDRAQAIAPSDPELARLAADLHLLRGDLPTGFALLEALYRDNRTADSDAGRLLQKDHLRDGLAGRRVVVLAVARPEDGLLYGRFLSRLAADGAEVVVVADPVMRNLFACLPGVARVEVPDAQREPADFFTPVQRLPYLYGATLESVRSAGPYLSIPKELATSWTDRLAHLSRPRVVLCWDVAVGAGPPARFPPAMSGLRAALEHAGAAIVLAQPSFPPQLCGYGDDDLLDLNLHTGDPLDVAAAIAASDIVIGSDTPVVHIAGALAKPCIAVLPVVADNRWLLDRDDSPWYPQTMLVRQRPQEASAAFVERAATKLSEWLKGQAPARYENRTAENAI